MTGLPTLPDTFADVVDARPLHGGSIAEVWRAELADGTTVVVKRTGYDATVEADGLVALGAAGAPVPQVLASGPRVLVLEHVSGPPAWHELGAALATCHRHGSADAYGWDRDNVIGPLPQPNPRTTDWAGFYVEHRVRVHLDQADALPSPLRTRLQRLCDGPLQELLSHDQRPSLVHGDLWSGNVVDGRWLIDPAVHYADRELDLAFAALFGGFPDAFHRGYAEVWPLDDGWPRRRPALQLHHLLVHVRLFGGSYVETLARTVDQIDRP